MTKFTDIKFIPSNFSKQKKATKSTNMINKITLKLKKWLLNCYLIIKAKLVKQLQHKRSKFNTG